MIRRPWLLFAVAGLLACNRAGQPGEGEFVTRPLAFREQWIAGTLSYDRESARTPAGELPLTVLLEIRNPDATIDELKLGTLSNAPCLQVRLLYRPRPDAPEREVQANAYHSPEIWSAAPMACFYVGLEWSWKLLLRSPGPSAQITNDGRLVVVTNEPRSSTEQFSILVTRRPQTQQEFIDYQDHLDRFTVARSEWVSLVTEQ